MTRISARLVPRLLSDDQKALRVSVCRELKQARDDPNFISNNVTGNETWVYGYDPEPNKSRRSERCQIHRGQKKSPSSSKQCRVHIDLFFFDIQGTVHKEFVSPGQTVNGKCYCEVLKRLREGIRRKRPDKRKKNNWFLHHDNAPAHTSLVVRQFLTSKNITVITHPLFA